MERTLNRLHVKLKESLDKHGHWNTYTEEEMLSKIEDEWLEYVEADLLGVVDGKHGTISELLDVAVTCIKMSHQLYLRTKLSTGEGTLS